MSIAVDSAPQPSPKPPRVLAIGGSDPSCGAGIQADLFALLHLGVAPATVITCVTAQNSQGVTSTHPLPATWVTEQLQAVWEDGAPAVAKVGLIGSAEVARAVADFLRENPVPLVVDPVLAASDGTPFLDEEAIQVLRQELFPLALLATPNFAEARVLVGGDSLPHPPVEDTTSPPHPPVEGRGEGMNLARAVRRLGPRWVLITGGDSAELPGGGVAPEIAANEAIDLLTDGENDWTFSAPRRPYEVRGTGCLLASAIAANLALGHEVPGAVDGAKRWVTREIDRAVRIGKGSRQAVSFLSGKE